MGVGIDEPGNQMPAAPVEPRSRAIGARAGPDRDYTTVLDNDILTRKPLRPGRSGGIDGDITDNSGQNSRAHHAAFLQEMRLVRPPPSDGAPASVSAMNAVPPP